MAFQGYKNTFHLNITHSRIVKGVLGEMHNHTVEVVLYIEDTSDEMVPFEEMERRVRGYLRQYEGVYLNEYAPFDEIEPTIEKLGEVLYLDISNIMKASSYVVTKLEIAETPTRVYVVDAFAVGDTSKQYNSERERRHAEYVEKISQQIEQCLIRKEESIDNLQEENTAMEALNTKGDNVKFVAEEESIATLEPVYKWGERGLERIQYTPKQHRNRRLWTITALLIFALGAFAWMLYLYMQDLYPLGLDIFGHIYKSDYLYHEIGKGNFYPLFNEYWYNGIQPYRYWAPFPYYILAFLQWIAQGSMMGSYLLFCGMAMFVSACGWLLFGIKKNRIPFSIFLGLFWSFLPNMITIFYSEGNFPRMVITMLVPYITYYIWSYIEEGKQRYLIGIISMTCLITVCHAMMGAILGVGTFLLVLIYSITYRRVRESIRAILCMLIAYLITGIWLYPALKGGFLGIDVDNASDFLTTANVSAKYSLNAFLRLKGANDYFYFGLSILVIAAIGILIANKKSRIGFLVCIGIFTATTKLLLPIIEKMPLNQVLWMTRFAPLAYAAFFVALLEWKNCRKRIVVILCMLMLLDASLSWNLRDYLKTMPGEVTAANMDEVADDFLLSDAAAITTQRVALMDLSRIQSFPSYYFGKNKVQYAFGWAWQGASTSSNIVMINTAYEKEYYLYMFDRCIELGNDTVLVDVRHGVKKDSIKQDFIEAGKQLGYVLINEKDYMLLFHKDTPGQFGVITEYENLAIGKSAALLTMEYPSFEEGASNNLDDYTLEELAEYKMVYLSGFTYADRERAEEKILQLSELGTEVYVDMNTIPFDSVSNRQKFMGVTAQSITFYDTFPELIYKGASVQTNLFSEDYRDWNTVYVDNLDNVTGYATVDGNQLAFSGTKYNQNLHFIGYNLIYHLTETRDNGVENIVCDMFQLSPNTLPTRELVPITIDYTPNSVTINTTENNVNTTIAWQDNFKTTANITESQNLLKVNEGTTTIQFEYPYWKKAVAISLIGVIAAFGYLLWLRTKDRKER